MPDNNRAQMDSISRQGGTTHASGMVAAMLMQSNFDLRVLRPYLEAAQAGEPALSANAVLRKDEWIMFDRVVSEIARKRLVVTTLLLAAGLRTPIANALGVTRVEWQRMGDMSAAEVSMSGISVSEYDRVAFDLQGMPVPIIHKDFTINIRALESSRRTGQPLDTIQIEVATRKVAEQIESLIFNGTTLLGSNNAIYGLTTATNRNTGSVSATWTTATGAQIVTDVLAMINKMYGDNMYGPYVLFVPLTPSVHLSDDYNSAGNPGLTIWERVLAIPQISRIIPTAELTGTNIIMVQLTRDTIDMLDGIQPTTVQWETHGGMVMHFKVLAIMVPRIRDDYLTQSGIVHYS